MVTYWCNPKTNVAGSLASHSSSGRAFSAPQNPFEASSDRPSPRADGDGSKQQGSLDDSKLQSSFSNLNLDRETEDEKQESACPGLQRSISFVSGVLLSLLRQVVARRLAMGKRTVGQTQATRQARMAMQPEPGTLVLEEMEEIICLPKFDAKATRRFVDPDSVELPTEVIDQLHRFVTVIALMWVYAAAVGCDFGINRATHTLSSVNRYQDNPFHNFHHAVHVSLSCSKLLSRIVAPQELENDETKTKRRAYESKLHDTTFGITSDPITQFAIVFAALIHDCDHPGKAFTLIYCSVDPSLDLADLPFTSIARAKGVPNSVLVNNKTEIAQHYRNKSVAEQNSLDVAWDLLMDDAYADLCACIFRNESELHHFRQLLVNVSSRDTTHRLQDMSSHLAFGWRFFYRRCSLLIFAMGN